jgi:hypothetical protein
VFVTDDFAFGDDAGADLAPANPDANPPHVVAPIATVNFVGVTDGLVVGAGFTVSPPAALPVCASGPRGAYQSSPASSISTPEDDTLSLETVAGALAVDYTGFELSLYELPAVQKFVAEATRDTTAIQDADGGWSGDRAAGFIDNLYHIETGGFGLDRAFPWTKVGNCGDGYVDSVRLGANIAFGLKLTFQNDEQRWQFTYKYGSVRQMLMRNDLGWVSVYLDGKASIEIAAAQFGGDPQKLAAIVNATQCSIGNLQACSDTIHQVAQYSGKQLQTDLGPLPADGATSYGGYIPLFGSKGSLPLN